MDLAADFAEKVEPSPPGIKSGRAKTQNFELAASLSRAQDKAFAPPRQDTVRDLCDLTYMYRRSSFMAQYEKRLQQNRLYFGDAFGAYCFIVVL